MVSGKIKWFNELSGHGFIQLQGGKDVYVHYTAFQERDENVFNSGTLVRFDLIETEQGPEAYNVEILKETGT